MAKTNELDIDPLKLSEKLLFLNIVPVKSIPVSLLYDKKEEGEKGEKQKMEIGCGLHGVKWRFMCVWDKIHEYCV